MSFNLIKSVKFSSCSFKYFLRASNFLFSNPSSQGLHSINLSRIILVSLLSLSSSSVNFPFLTLCLLNNQFSLILSFEISHYKVLMRCCSS